MNWVGIISWILGGGFALMETLGIFSVFSPALDGVILAFVAYIILYKLLSGTKMVGQGVMTIEEATAKAR